MQGLGQEVMLSLHAELGARILTRSHPTCSCTSCQEALGRLLGVDTLLFIAPAFPIPITDRPWDPPHPWKAGSCCRRGQELQWAGERESHGKEGKP